MGFALNQPRPGCASRIERTVWDGDQVLTEMRSVIGNEDEVTIGDNFYGAVRYTNAAGIDDPIAIWKIDLGGVIPHRSWRRTFLAGTGINGTRNLSWTALAQDVFHAPDVRLTPIQPSDSIGSIVENKTDPSGLQCCGIATTIRGRGPLPKKTPLDSRAVRTYTGSLAVTL